MAAKMSKRDGLYIDRAWQWDVLKAHARLGVWETHPKCEPGDVTISIDTTQENGESSNGYIRLAPAQQAALAAWLAPQFQTQLDEAINVLADALKQQSKLVSVTKERDAWRREAATLTFKMEDLRHEVGALRGQIRRIKGYINSIGG